MANTPNELDNVLVQKIMKITLYSFGIFTFSVVVGFIGTRIWLMM